MVMLGLAGDVAGGVVRQLQPPRHAGANQRLHGAEDGRPPDPRTAAADALPQLLGGQLPAGGGQGIGHQQALRRDALTGGAQPVPGGCQAIRTYHTATPTTPAQIEKR